MTAIDSFANARRIAEHLLSARSGAAPPAPAPTRASLNYPRLQHHIRWFDGLLRLYRAAAAAVAQHVVIDDRSADHAASAAGADPLIDVVRRLHGIVLQHPIAAKAAYAALARQGRAFATTPDGAKLRARLVRSRRLQRASLVWRSLTMGMLDDQDPGELPATYLDNLLRVVDRDDLEQLLSALQLRKVTP